MKTLKRILLITSLLCLVVSCTKSDDFFDQGAYDLKCRNMSPNGHSHGLDQDRYVTMSTLDLKVHYKVIGKGPVDIVFIPGWTNPLEIYTKQFDYFRDKARCIYIDVPGQGLSDAPEGVEYTMGMMADAIYDVVKKEGVKKFVAVGFSMGPVPLGQFELKHPGMITKLVDLDGGFYYWPPEGDPARETFIAETEGFCSWIETWGPAEKEWFASLLVTENSPADLMALIPYFSEFPSWLMANIYRNYTHEEVNQPIGWTFPILSIYSSEPPLDIYEVFFPGADIHVMEGFGHVLQWENAAEVNQLIWEFAYDQPGRKCSGKKH